MVALSRSLVRASRRYLLRHPWNLWLSLLGIGLGVAVVIAVDLANASARTAFRLSMEAVTGRTTHEIRGGPQGIPEGIYTELRRHGGNWRAAPVVEGSVRIQDRAYTLLGLDPLAEEPFRGELAEFEGGALTELLTQPATLAVPARAAEQLGAGPGAVLDLEVAGVDAEVRVASVFETDNPAAEGMLVADVATAQELLGRIGFLDRIDLILAPGQEGEIAELLPAGLRLQRSEVRTRTSEQMTEAFQLNLSAMSLLALLVGGFIIYNTTTFSVLQRRSLFGHLRVLGVTRGELFRLVLAEAMVLGVLGTLIGLAAGAFIAQFLVHLVTRTINDLYFTLNVTRLFISPFELTKGAVIGIGATLLAALGPAWEAARSDPREVQLRSRIESRVQGLVPALAIAGLVLAVAGVGLAQLPGGGLLGAFAALFLVIFGFSLLVPLLLSRLGMLLLPAVALVGPPMGRLAGRGILRSLSRTGPAVAALTVAVSATVGVGVMIGSFRTTVTLWLEQTLTSDIYISAPSAVSNRAATALPDGILERLDAIAGIAGISRGRSVQVDGRRGGVELLAVRMADHSVQGFRFKDRPLDRVWYRFAREPLVLISEPYANRHGLDAGANLELFTARGWQDFTVGGVFYDYGTDQGKLVMHQPLYTRLWNDPRISAVGIRVQDRVALSEVLEAVQNAMSPLGDGVQVRPTREIREHSLEVFDRTFAVTRVLRLLALGVAFIGILSALLALHLEQAREYAILRASGATPGQMWLLVSLQSALMGLFSGLFALPLGWLMSDILINVVNLRSFGWTMQTILPPGILLEAVVLALVAALLAGLYPAWRIAGSPPAAALRDE
jgi:putative ABC transport system permease protein